MENINNLIISYKSRYVKRYILPVVLLLILPFSAGAGIGIGLEEMQKMFGPLKWDMASVTNGFPAVDFRSPTQHVWSRAVFQVLSNDTVVVEELHSAEKDYDIPPAMVYRLMDACNPGEWKIMISVDGNIYHWKGYDFRCAFGLVFRSADDKILCLIHRNSAGKVQHLQFISESRASCPRFKVAP